MMDTKIINFTKDNYLNHKKDKKFFQTFIDTAKLYLFITKTYKIVKIFNNEIYYIFDLYDFCQILIHGYFKNVYFDSKLNLKIKLINKKRHFTICYKNDHKEILNLTNLKCKMLMNEFKQFYLSFIFNNNNLSHIENKKKEIKFVMDCIKKKENNNQNKNFIKLICNKTFFKPFLLNYDIIIARHILYYYFLQK